MVETYLVWLVIRAYVRRSTGVRLYAGASREISFSAKPSSVFKVLSLENRVTMRDIRSVGRVHLLLDDYISGKRNISRSRSSVFCLQ